MTPLARSLWIAALTLLPAAAWPGPPRTVKDCPVCPELVAISAGQFMMGSPEDEAERDPSEGPQHRVRVAAFLLGRTEVTQGQWRSVMGSNPSRFSDCGDDCPVEQVSWDDAQAYLAKLRQRTGKAYRLPSEAEWEYAARAGSTTPFPTGATLSSKAANFDGSRSYNGGAPSESRGQVLPVASLAPNAFGLFDMHGNVWEWVEDVWHPSYQGAPRTAAAWTVASPEGRRVSRGGSFDYDAAYLRSAYRGGAAPDHRNFDAGFRVARSR